MIAEDHPALRGAAGKAPVDNPSYRSVYIPLPRTGDTLMAMFSATVVLQRLALKMSLLKKQYLDRLGIADHGVHPDVPKNVGRPNHRRLSGGVRVLAPSVACSERGSLGKAELCSSLASSWLLVLRRWNRGRPPLPLRALPRPWRARRLRWSRAP